MDLFEKAQGAGKSASTPLAERLRPRKIEDFVGQQHVVGESSAIMKALRGGDRIPNLILWGPPGTGKTTLAYLLAEQMDNHFLTVNAVDTGAKQLRTIGQEARQRRLQHRQFTLLFVDEIHRFNKAQQDVLLPFAEKGDLILVGATTENPSYELNGALLSRCRVVGLERLSEQELTQLLQRAFAVEELNIDEWLQSPAQQELVRLADGDGRQLLNLVEQLWAYYQQNQTGEDLSWPASGEALQAIVEARPFYYDKDGDEHYDCISAFIKSVRGSDPDAGLYYLARMVEGGEDPVFIARRLVILASEDVGNADPRALTVAVSGLQAVELVGFPEAAINLAQVTTYLASAPKSNKSYQGLKRAQSAVKETGQLPIPKALRSAETSVTRQFGYGQGYRYSHDGPKGWLKQQFLPEQLQNESFYEPVNRGFEKNIRQYLAWMKEQTGDEDSSPGENT